MELPNMKYFQNKQAKTLDVVLHGSSHGMNSSLIAKIIEASKNQGNSVIAFNFPYFERGEKKSSGPELVEEIEALQSVLNHCMAKSYDNIRLIGKSLGGIVAGQYLSNLDSSQSEKYTLIIFGYVIGYENLKTFPGKIIIVQGSKDKFGDIESVKNDLQGSASKDITYLSIEGADHSYRDPNTKEPIYENKAIEKAFSPIPS